MRPYILPALALVFCVGTWACLYQPVKPFVERSADDGGDSAGRMSSTDDHGSDADQNGDSRAASDAPAGDVRPNGDAAVDGDAVVAGDSTLSGDTVAAGDTSPLLPAPIFWLNASDLNGNGDGNAGWSDGQLVGTWKDASGNGFDATAPAALPMYVAAAASFGGASVVRFNGISAYLEANALATHISVTLDDMTDGLTIVYVKSISGLNKGVWLGFYATPTMEPLRLGVRTVGGGGYVLFVDLKNERLESQDFTTAPIVHSLVMDNDSPPSVQFWKAGVLESQLTKSPVNNPPPFSGFTKFAIGQDWDDDGSGGWVASDFHAGEIAEILIYDHALSDMERSAVEAYLEGKYGL